MALTVELTEAWWKKHQDKDLDKTASAAYEKAVKDYQKCNGNLAETDRALDELLKAARGLHKEIDTDLKALQKNKKKSADEKKREKKLIALNKAFGGDFVREVGKARDALNATEDARAKADAKRKDAEDAKADEKDAKGKGAKPDAKDTKADEKDAKGKDVKEAEDDEDEAALSRDAQAAYLRKMLPKLKSKTHSFALAMPTNDPADMRFIFHVSKQPVALAGQIRKATKAKRVSFGRAGIGDLADEHGAQSKSGTLDLVIESKLIPQLAKRARMMLKALDAGALKKVRILDMSGKVLDDDDDSTDGAQPDPLPKKPFGRKSEEAKTVKSAAAFSGAAALDPKQKAQREQLLERIVAAEALVRKIDLDGDKLNRLLMQLGGFKADVLSKEVDFAALQRLLQAVATLAAQGRRSAEGTQAKEPAEARNAALAAKLDERHALAMKMPETTDAERKAKKEALRKIGELREKIGRTDTAEKVEKGIATEEARLDLRALVGKNQARDVRHVDALAARAQALGPEADQKKLMTLAKAARESVSRDADETGADPIFDFEIELVLAEADLAIDQVLRDIAQIGLPLPQVSGDAAASAMKNDAFFKNLFVDQNGAEKTNPQGQKVLDNLKSQLDLYDKHFKGTADPVTANAMKMLIMLKAAGRQAAGQENLANQATFTKKLLQYHGEDLMKSLAAADGSGPDEETLRASLQLLHGLVSDDPVRPYMEKEIKTQGRAPTLEESEKLAFEKVVERVGDMAARAGIPGEEMLELLEQAHQLEVASFTLDEVKKGELTNVDPATGKAAVSKFFVENVTGEISPAYFQELLDLNNGSPQWNGDQLAYSDVAKKKIDQLRDAFTLQGPAPAPIPVPPKAPRPPKPPAKLSKKQQREAKAKHGAAMQNILDQIRDGSARAGLSRPNDPNFVPPPGYDGGAATAEEQQQFDGGITEKQYRFLRGVVRDELAGADDSDPAAARVEVADYFVNTMGLTRDAAEKLFDRCKAYLEAAPLTISCNAENMFNEDGSLHYGKDYTTEQVRGKETQSDAERFGAPGATDSTVSFKPGETADRGDQYPRWRREKDERETGGNQFLAQENAVFGAVNVNFPKSSGGQGSSYGTDHLIMRDSIRPVTTYCYTTGGKERRDMALILQDMVRDKTAQRQRHFIGAVVGNATADPKYWEFSDLDLEFHCYGPIDLTRDVAQISVPSPDAAGSTENEAVRKRHGNENDEEAERKRLEAVNERVQKFSQQTKGMQPPMQWTAAKSRPQEELHARPDEQGSQPTFDRLMREATARIRYDPAKQPDFCAAETAKLEFEALNLGWSTDQVRAEAALKAMGAALKRAAADKAVDRKKPPFTTFMDDLKTKQADLKANKKKKG